MLEVVFGASCLRDSATQLPAAIGSYFFSTNVTNRVFAFHAQRQYI